MNAAYTDLLEKLLRWYGEMDGFRGAFETSAANPLLPKPVRHGYKAKANILRRQMEQLYFILTKNSEAIAAAGLVMPTQMPPRPCIQI